MIRILLAVAGLSILSGCVVNKPLYYWGDYEQAYFDYEKNPGEIDEYITSLDGIIIKGEEKNTVPPGLYAEYGYALLVAGRNDEAMANFAKERDKWPESRKLMGLLIDGPDAATPLSGEQPDLDERQPFQATPSEETAIIDASPNLDKLSINNQESEE